MYEAVSSRSLDANLSDITITSDTNPSLQRPRVQGKFLYLGDENFWVRGVTYGTFRPDAEGQMYHARTEVARDFALMAANGLNAIRTYTAPPRWLLDLAQQNGLHVMVGLPWEQHITFLDDAVWSRRIEQRVREAYPPATWKRMAAVKAKYDPTNLFRLNQNVPPG